MKFFSHPELTLELFKSSLENLPKNNRWVKLGDTLPWDKIEKVYNSKLNNKKAGAPNKSARMVVGSLIVKHKYNLSDVETIEEIKENPYLQYLCGLSEYTDKPIFDPSLFVTIRKRLGSEELNSFTLELMAVAQSKDKGDKNDGDQNNSSNEIVVDAQGREHKGSMKIDATCFNQEVRFPTDWDLLLDGVILIHRFIKKICKRYGIKRPITHLSEAMDVHRKLIKHKTKTKKNVKQCKMYLLRYLHQDICTLLELVAKNDTNLLDALTEKEKNTLSDVFTMYHQQDEMFRNDINRCDERIISLFQSFVRPIIRGKAGAKTEFGAKGGISVVNGYTFVDHISWSAYNEATDLIEQIKLFKERFGYLPQKVLADKIYMNRANRSLMKELGIEAAGRPLGRPSKVKNLDWEAKMKQASSERNEVEATIGTAKRVYRANNIRAKRSDTSHCWIACCIFTKNVMKFLKGLLCALFSKIAQNWLILRKFWIFSINFSPSANLFSKMAYGLDF